MPYAYHLCTLSLPLTSIVASLIFPTFCTTSISKFNLAKRCDRSITITSLFMRHIQIGILGRTGSGKSTLALSFFRFVEATEGRIVVDGLDLANIGLADLRSRMTIIPRECLKSSNHIRPSILYVSIQRTPRYLAAPCEQRSMCLTNTRTLKSQVLSPARYYPLFLIS